MSAETLHQGTGTLLIVDDIPANVSVLFEFLTSAGFKVLVAQEGKRAISKAEYAQPDLILLDVMMPGMDGFEACQILKATEKTKDIPIIFMTALADTVDKVKGFNLGAADYITKPIQHEEVLARITTHLNIRKLQKQLEVRGLELEKRNSELEAFNRTVAHDLKNPLNLVVGYSDMLVEDLKLGTPIDADSIKMLGHINQTGHKMVNIIHALLLLSGVSKQGTVEITPLDMHTTVSKLVAEERVVYVLNEFKGEIIIQPPGNAWNAAKGYEPWIEEIWINYLTNGLKYGGRPPRIEVGVDAASKGMVRFWVRDNGAGISAEAQTRLFIPFTRLHTTGTGDLSGLGSTGVGLSIVQQIAEKLGGQVGVESTEGQGSLFYFTLPVADNHAPA